MSASAGPTYTTLELIHGGDFACAENQAGTLAAVARTLADRLAPPIDHELREVARLAAAADMAAASARWNQVTARLRARA